MREEAHRGEKHSVSKRGLFLLLMIFFGVFPCVGKKELVEKLQQSHKEIQGLEEASRSQVSSCNITILRSSMGHFVQSVEVQFYCCGPLIDARD